MTNRINGDFGQDALEAFRAAYAAQMANPEDHDVDPVSGIPSNTISNTSPWIKHTGLWKANDGMSRDFKPNQPFNPEDYFGNDGEEESKNPPLESLQQEEEPEVKEEDPDYLTEEEFKALSKRIWDEPDDESEGEEDGDEDGEEDPEYQPYSEDGDESEDEEDFNDEEIETLIDEILKDGAEEDDDYEDGEGEDFEDERDEEDE